MLASESTVNSITKGKCFLMLNLLLNLDFPMSIFETSLLDIHPDIAKLHVLRISTPLTLRNLSHYSMKFRVKRIKKISHTTKLKENWMWFKSITDKAKRRPVIFMHTHISHIVVVVVTQKCWLKATLRSKVEVRGGGGKFDIFMGGDDK